MRETLDLSAEPRAKRGKGPAYQARKQGRIPGIVYGGEVEPAQVSVDERTLTKLYSSGAFLQTLVNLEIGGKKTRVIPRAVQLDPVTDRVMHVDFLRLVPGGQVRLDIPVHFKGQENSPGLKRGGVLNVVRHEVALMCPVDAIPEFIEGDLDGLDIGDSLHISAFALPEGVRPMIRERNFTVATIAPPTTYTEEVTTTAAAAATAEGAEAAPAEGAAPGEGGAAAPAAAAPAAEKGKGAEKK
jgi:large subunit ribosomal protein L25